MAIEATDITTLNDHDFLDERRRVLEELESSRSETTDCAELRAHYDEMNAEFDRRARAAWATAPAGQARET